MRFYKSQTYKTLQNTENAFWAESAEYIAERYFEEMKKRHRKSIKCSNGAFCFRRRLPPDFYAFGLKHLGGQWRMKINHRSTV